MILKAVFPFLVVNPERNFTIEPIAGDSVVLYMGVDMFYRDRIKILMVIDAFFSACCKASSRLFPE
jgi:acetoin utilization deacetylase AcuC-like enzyme